MTLCHARQSQPVLQVAKRVPPHSPAQSHIIYRYRLFPPLTSTHISKHPPSPTASGSFAGIHEIREVQKALWGGCGEPGLTWTVRTAGVGVVNKTARGCCRYGHCDAAQASHHRPFGTDPIINVATVVDRPLSHAP